MDKQNTSDPQNPKKKLKSFKIFLIAGAGLLVLLVLGGGIVFFVFSSFSSGDSPFMGKLKGMVSGGKKPAGTASVAVHKMEPFLVNLADPGQFRYLKVTLHVETQQKGEEFEKRLPQSRDSVLTILSSKNSKDIMTSEGKNALREEIKEKMNHLLTETKVRYIYFTEFVIQ
jgi:flagellar FliL protein